MHVVGDAIERLRPMILLLAFGLRTSAANAAPPSPETLACMSASKDGQVERDRGHLLAARELFRACAQLTCPSVVTKSCTEWLVDIDARIPSVVIRVSERGADDITQASVLVDGRSVPLDGRPVELDPGAHDIRAAAPDWLPSERKVLLAEGERARLVLFELERAAPPPAPVLEAPPPQPAIASLEQREPTSSFQVPVGSWILGGIGVAGVASFVVLRVEAGRELNHLKDTCSPRCSHEETVPGRRLALAADLSLGVAAVALAGAGAWALGSWLGHESNAPQLACVPVRGGLLASLALRY